MSAIIVHNLHRNFGSLKAVDGVSFEIPPGSVCGFVGANGAGKTTTMRIIASLDHPTFGTAEICNINVVNYPGEARRILGWMPDHFGNYDHMTVIEYLDFYARALGFKSKERRTRIDEVMDFTDLVPLAERFSNKLSKGMTQRLGLARTLLHDPQVLVMDEPAAGLDPKARVELKHLIRILATEGKTLFISSHILSELGEMCDSLLFIDKGRIVHHGDAETLRKGGQENAGMIFDVGIASDPQSLSDWAVLQPNVKIMEARKHGARLLVESNDPKDAALVLSRMVRDGLDVVEFHKEQRNLEDAFIDIVDRLERGESALPPPIPQEIGQDPEVGGQDPEVEGQRSEPTEN